MPEITNGSFWDANACSPNSNVKKLVEIKKGLPVKKYGGYSKENYAFFFIYKSKGEKERLNFTPFPLAMVNNAKDIDYAVREYAVKLCQETGEQFIEIVIPRIYKYQKIEWNCQQFYLTGQKDIRSAALIYFSQNDLSVLMKHKDGSSADNQDVLRMYANFKKRASKQSAKLFKQLKLEEKDNEIQSLTSEQICTLVRNLSLIFSGKNNVIDLRIIGGVKQMGRINLIFNNEINDLNNRFYVIDQSVTGMFERRRRIGL